MALTDAPANVGLLTTDHVAPESSDRNIPAPAYVHPTKFASPVPAYTTFGDVGENAIAPIARLGCLG